MIYGVKLWGPEGDGKRMRVSRKRIVNKKGKVPRWGPSALQPIGLLYSDPEGVASFISRGAAHRLVRSATASEGRNYVEGT
jgi:hypothetical protein